MFLISIFQYGVSFADPRFLGTPRITGNPSRKVDIFPNLTRLTAWQIVPLNARSRVVNKTVIILSVNMQTKILEARAPLFPFWASFPKLVCPPKQTPPIDRRVITQRNTLGASFPSSPSPLFLLRFIWGNLISLTLLSPRKKKKKHFFIWF